jgi:predicted nucleotidyltransferase
VESPEILTHDLDRETRDRILSRVGGCLSERSEILFAYAHGSFVQESFFRDLDIAVFVDPREITGRTFYEMDLQEELKKRLQVPFPVDVKTLNAAPLFFQFRAIGGRLLVDRAPAVRVDFCVRVMSRYFDIRPFLLHYMKEAFCDDIGSQTYPNKA